MQMLKWGQIPSYHSPFDNTFCNEKNITNKPVYRCIKFWWSLWYQSAHNEINAKKLCSLNSCTHISLIFAMSWVTELLPSQYFWLALYHGLVWASLLKTHRRLSTCVTTMHVRFVYERRGCATKVKMSHALTTLNSNNFIVYGVGTHILS